MARDEYWREDRDRSERPRRERGDRGGSYPRDERYDDGAGWRGGEYRGGARDWRDEERDEFPGEYRSRGRGEGGYGAGYGSNYGIRGGYGAGGTFGGLEPSSGGYGGMAGVGRQEPSRPNHAGRGPRNYRRSNERIVEDINEALTRHPAIDATDIDVRCENGEVILSGVVDSRQAKRLAEDIAESCFGVRDVRNELRVSRGDRQEASPPSDREVRRSATQETGGAARGKSKGGTGAKGLSRGTRN